jgi:hypothetical protein
MAVRVESQEIPEGLDGDDGAWECILLRDNSLEKHFQRLPCTSAEIGEQLSVIEKISAKGLRYVMTFILNLGPIISVIPAILLALQDG